MSRLEELSHMAPDEARLEFGRLAAQQSEREQWLQERAVLPIEVLAKQEGQKMANAFVDYAEGKTDVEFVGYFLFEEDFHCLAHQAFCAELNIASDELTPEQTTLTVVDKMLLRGHAVMSEDGETVTAARYTAVTLQAALGRRLSSLTD